MQNAALVDQVVPSFFPSFFFLCHFSQISFLKCLSSHVINCIFQTNMAAVGTEGSSQIKRIKEA